MDGSPEGFESETTAKIVVAGVVTAVLVPVLAVEAPAVLALLAVVGPLTWVLAQAGSFDGIGTTDSEPDEGEAALDRLRRRYADGDLTDEEFERRLDRLLETETLEDAKRYRTDAERRPDRTRDAELER